AKLDGDSDRAIEKPQRLFQQLEVDPKSWWQLDQDRTQLRTKGAGARHEAAHRFGGIVQPLEVRQVAAHLQREDEIGRTVVLPVLEDRRLGQVEIGRASCRECSMGVLW